MRYSRCSFKTVEIRLFFLSSVIWLAKHSSASCPALEIKDKLLSLNSLIENNETAYEQCDIKPRFEKVNQNAEPYLLKNRAKTHKNLSIQFATCFVFTLKKLIESKY